MSMARIAAEGWRMRWYTRGELSPTLSPLWDDPRYQAVLHEIRADLAAQREAFTKSPLSLQPKS